MTHRNNRSIAWTVPAIVTLSLLASASFSPKLRAADDLPKGEAVLAKIIEADGGLEALRKVKSRVVTLNLNFGSGMMGKGTSYSARPDKLYTKVELPGMGSIEEGSANGVAWELTMMMGPRIKEGGEKTTFLRDANFDGLLDWKSMYKKIECVAKEALEGKDYYKLELTSNEDDVITYYVDTATNLVHRIERKLETPLGTFDMSIVNEDYRVVDGVKYAHKTLITIKGMPPTRVITIEKIEHNVEIPEDRFKFPASIQALLDSAKKSEEEKKEKDG